MRLVGYDRHILDFIPVMMHKLSTRSGSEANEEHTFDSGSISLKHYTMPLAGSTPGATPEQQQLAKDVISTHFTVFLNMRDLLFARVPEAFVAYGINSRDEYNRLMEDVRQEWEQSEGCYMDLGVVSARKSL
jgi:hypothetical protein